MKFSKSSSICDTCTTTCDYGVCVNGECKNLAAKSQLKQASAAIVEKMSNKEQFNKQDEQKVVLDMVRSDPQLIKEILISIENSINSDATSSPLTDVEKFDFVGKLLEISQQESVDDGSNGNNSNSGNGSGNGNGNVNGNGVSKIGLSSYLVSMRR